MGKELEIKDDSINRIFEFADDVIENYPNRKIGTESCQKTSERIKDELVKSLGKNNVQVEPFEAHPASFLKYFRFAVISCYLILLLSFLHGLVPAGLINSMLLVNMGLALFILIMALSQFFFYKHTFDRFFPKKMGYNVIGVLEPENPVKQQIILEGHHDAAYVFTLLDRAPKLHMIFVNLASISIFIETIITTSWFILDTVASAQGGIFENAGFFQFILLALSILVTPMIWFTTSKVSPGAGDNLISTGLIIELARIAAKYEKENDTKLLDNTRVIFLSADGEECGLRGATAYCKKHFNEMQETKTHVLTLDVLYKKDEIWFTEREINGFVPVSRQLAGELVEMCNGMNIPAKIGSFSFGMGSTDAGAFSRDGKVESTNLVGVLKENLFKVPYHTSRDSTRAIDKGIVEQALQVCSKFITLKDGK